MAWGPPILRRLRWSGCVLGAVVTLAHWVTGCYDGLPPTMQIPDTGEPIDFIPPPPDFTPGTSTRLGVLYFYDQSTYTVYTNEGGRNQIPPGADPYIRRGGVLSIIGATAAQVVKPDTVDAVLAAVYGNPDLFGFEPAVGRAPGFDVGERIDHATDFMPACMSSGTCADSYWSYNHVQFQWARRIVLMGTTTSSTSAGATTWILRDSCHVRESLRTTYLPAVYTSDSWWSVVPGRGIFLHGMHLVAERDEIVMQGGSPPRQRNPTLLWVSQLSLGGGVSNQNEVQYTSLDQCVDAMWGDIDLYPLQLTGSDLQVGDRTITWTYVSADSAEIRRRVTGFDHGEGSEFEQIRCSAQGSPPLDVPLDSAAFPIFYFKLLVRYEVDVERLYDVLEWKSGNNVVGRYGDPDGVVDVVKLVARVYVVSPHDELAQQVDLYLMRGIGIVVQQTGIEVFDISRLREAQVNGQYFPPEYFGYADN